jgi:pectinesterase
VINDRYMVDDYHRDNGEGADLYSAGRSRGCGGNGIWDAGKLYTSANFVESRTLANGPIRVVFELTYPAFDAGGARVTEVKRITLDAGQNLNRFESRYTVSPSSPKTQAAGIKKAAEAIVVQDKARGLLRTWEPVKADGSHFGCGIIVEPGDLVGVVEAGGNVLVVTRVAPGGTVTYYAGSSWDRSGDFQTVDDWDRYLDQAARRIRSPLAVSLAAR